MSLSSGRDKRVTAGNRLHRMLAEEADEEDDFYKTTYGGFSEEVDDNEYESEASGNETSSDSDISASEDDEPESDDEDEGPKRKRRVVTKAYKEPPKNAAASKPKVTSKVNKEKTTVERKTTQKPEIDPMEDSLSSSLRKSSRRSTIQRVTEFKFRIKEREEKAKKIKEQTSKKNMPEVRRLTQEELLKEAKKTEIENKASLKAYQLLEASRKKQKFTKQVYKGPTIKYRSMSMPFVEEIATQTNSNSTAVVVDKDDRTPRAKVPTEQKKCSRNFITFSDVKTYDEYFPHKKTRSHGKQICPVTRLSAKYLDPITNIPYATIQAFKLIRETYVPEHTEELLEYRKTIKSYPQPKAS